MTTASAAPISTAAVMQDAWRIARAAAARFGGKVRHFFGPALKQAWAAARAPAVEVSRFRIARIEDLTRRAGGSVSFVRAAVETEVGQITVTAKTRVATAHEVSIDGPFLVLSGSVRSEVLDHMERVRPIFEARVARIAAVSPLAAKLLRIGNLWEKGGHSRVYFDIDAICDAAGFACTFYGTGNMSWAAQDGVQMSNTSGTSVYYRLVGAKIHYDLVENQWSCMDTISDETWDRIRNALIARAEEANATL